MAGERLRLAGYAEVSACVRIPITWGMATLALLSPRGRADTQ